MVLQNKNMYVWLLLFSLVSYPLTTLDLNMYLPKQIADANMPATLTETYGYVDSLIEPKYIPIIQKKFGPDTYPVPSKILVGIKTIKTKSGTYYYYTIIPNDKNIIIITDGNTNATKYEDIYYASKRTYVISNKKPQIAEIKTITINEETKTQRSILKEIQDKIVENINLIVGIPLSIVFLIWAKQKFKREEE